MKLSLAFILFVHLALFVDWAPAVESSMHISANEDAVALKRTFSGPEGEAKFEIEAHLKANADPKDGRLRTAFLKVTLVFTDIEGKILTRTIDTEYALGFDKDGTPWCAGGGETQKPVNGFGLRVDASFVPKADSASADWEFVVTLFQGAKAPSEAEIAASKNTVGRAWKAGRSITIRKRCFEVKATQRYP